MFVIYYLAVDNKWYPVVRYDNLDNCYLFVLSHIIIYGHSITRYKVIHNDFEIKFYKNL